MLNTVDEEVKVRREDGCCVVARRVLLRGIPNGAFGVSVNVLRII